MQAWQLKENERYQELIDPELTEYPAGEVIRFIKVALFCTQAAANRRPTMKQVVEMLSTEVNLNEKLLTAPGVYWHSSSHSRRSLLEKSLSHASRGKTRGNSSASFAQFDTCQSLTRILPR